MKKAVFLAVSICMLSIAAYSQKQASFSGVWTLDVAKSKLNERERIESRTMTVTQSGNELKVEVATKRLPPPADAPEGRMGGGGGMGRGGDGTTVYSADGKETTVEVEGPNGKSPMKLKATIEGNKATLTQTRTFNSPNGEISVVTKETWDLAADGKSLTVVRESSGGRMASSTTMVFSKK